MSIEAQLDTSCLRCNGGGHYRTAPTVRCSCPAGKLTPSFDVMVSRIEPDRARIVIIEAKSGLGAASAKAAAR